MQLGLLAVFVCIVLVSLCPEGSDGEAKKLQIGVKKRPEECPIKTKPGDKVHMHYKVGQSPTPCPTRVVLHRP